jgi:dissimilatory sulfite reductase related protein
MSTATYAGVAVELNDEGFFVDPNQWTRDIAVELAKADGIDQLTDQHWTVLEFMRKEYFEKGTGACSARPPASA